MKIPKLLSKKNLNEYGNVKIEDIVYDKTIEVWVNEKWVTRYFPTRYCAYEHCSNQIKPFYRHDKYDKKQVLTTNSEALKAKYCCQQCANMARRKPEKLKSNNSKVKKSRPIKVLLSKKEAIIENFIFGRLNNNGNQSHSSR